MDLVTSNGSDFVVLSDEVFFICITKKGMCKNVICHLSLVITQQSRATLCSLQKYFRNYYYHLIYNGAVVTALIIADMRKITNLNEPDSSTQCIV